MNKMVSQSKWESNIKKNMEKRTEKVHEKDFKIKSVIF